MGLDPYLLEFAQKRVKSADVPATPMSVPTPGATPPAMMPGAAPPPPTNAAPTMASPPVMQGNTMAPTANQVAQPQAVTTSQGAANVPGASAPKSPTMGQK